MSFDPQPQFTSEQRARIDRVAGAALQLPDAERKAYVNAQCADDPAARDEILALLDVARRTDQTAFMKEPAALPQVETVTSMRAPVDVALTQIDRYRIVSKIGEGGFGIVYLAEQEKPVRRRVALKIIKLGMDTQQVIARFEHERQALAMMDHPNIAKVFDAGATETGRPYFVMELVTGVPITEYCDKQNMSFRDRLGLFMQVCVAVQHAHQKGIIHRDIKPSNVLVTLVDEKPVPKVIDFGIAKATEARLTEQTMFTELGQFVGTPAYMSPEQTDPLGWDIDTRSDIYSLGVLLYELLTGATPFDVKSLRKAGFDEIRRIIREVDPPRPSTRLSMNADTLASVAAQRHIEPRKLVTVLRGDLDWIIMKALEKERARRYETANGLAADIQRYLAGEAVIAAPPSAAYRLKKFIRRNKGPVIAASLLALALVGGLIGTSYGLRQAVKAREAEAAQRRAAEAERDKANIIADFMSNTLQGANVSVALGRDITMLKEMLDQAANRIDQGGLKNAPDAELSLRTTIGATYADLALYPQAARMLEPVPAKSRMLHPGDSDYTADALTQLAFLAQNQGDLASAETRYREALAMRRRLHPGDDQRVALALESTATLLNSRKKLEEAEILAREALAMQQRLTPADNPEVAVDLNVLSLVLRQQGKKADAERLLRESIDMQKRVFHGDHPDIAANLHNLVDFLKERGDLGGAETVARESLEMNQRLFPHDHPNVARNYQTLASLLLARGKLTEAEPCFRESLAINRRLNPGDHRNTMASLNNLAFVLLAQGNPAAAEPFAREAADMSERMNGRDDFATGNARMRLGSALAGLSRFGEAEVQLIEAERVISMAKSAPPGRYKQSVQALVDLYETWAKSEQRNGHDEKAAQWKAQLDHLQAATQPATSRATTGAAARPPR